MISAGVGSWEYIDEYMTVPRFVSLQNYWEKVPPTHVSAALIAYALGAITPTKDSRSNSNPSAQQVAGEIASPGLLVPGVKVG